MLFSTTADPRLWEPNQPMVFAGEWCRRPELKNMWSNIEHNVLPYHWNDRGKLHQDYIYIRSLQEELLPKLTEILNIIHKTSYSQRYWSINLGPWLISCLTILFDRYCCIRSAEKIDTLTESFGWIHEDNKRVPTDTMNFMMSVISEPLNDFIFGQILLHRKRIKLVYRGEYPDNKLATQLKSNGGLEHQRLLDRWALRLVPSSMLRFRCYSRYLGRLDVMRLMAQLKQLPARATMQIASPSAKYSQDLRGKLTDMLNTTTNNDDFKSLVHSLLPQLIPCVYLENYLEFKNEVLTNQGRRIPRVLLNAGYFTDDAYKILAGETAEHGGKIISSQHGGNYGLARISCYEDIEINESDIYYSWGWNKLGYEGKVVPTSSPYLFHISKRLKPDPTGKILWVQNSVPSYTYNIYSAVLGPQFGMYLKDQATFARHLDPEVLKQIVLRLFERDVWDERNFWKDTLPEISIDSGGSIVTALSRCRLCISTMNTTTFIETLATNFPTLAFWNPEHWEIRDEAEPFFERLLKVGVLHYSPESAANFLNQVASNIQKWWLAEDVQKAKNEFCSKYARSSNDWIKQMKATVGQLIKT